jgi:hypothetical protein
MCAKKLVNLSDGKPNPDSLKSIDCNTCNGTGKIGDKNCPMCGGVGSMTRSKMKRLNKKS